MSSRNTWLTQSITGAAVRKLRVRWRGAAPNAVAGREERGDVGAAEAVDRLLGVADDEQAAGVDRRSRPTVGRARRGRPTRAARRARSGSGRCPGTRRAAGACSGRAAVRRTSPAVLGSRSSARASTSRSWNSSWPLRPALVGLAQGELRELPRQAPHRRLGERGARSSSTSSRSAFTVCADDVDRARRRASCPSCPSVDADLRRARR